MDLLEPGANQNAGQMIKDELAEKCQKLFQAFLEEWVNAVFLIVLLDHRLHDGHQNRIINNNNSYKHYTLVQ